jgi:hypothetical protein
MVAPAARKRYPVATAFTKPRPSKPVNSLTDTTWLAEIDNVEVAVDELLEAKRWALRNDPQKEHVLSLRYNARLMRIKRRLDAICI